MSVGGDMAGRRLVDKVAIVTGSSAGIGLAIARRLGQEGAKVVISSRKQHNVDKAVQDLKASGIEHVHGVTCHVANQQHRQTLVDQTLAKYNRVDLLINNAGINPAFGDILEVSSEVWQKLFEVNVQAGFELTKLCVPHIQKNGSGSVVFVSSVSAYLPSSVIGAYGVTKTALLGLTKALSLSCAHKKIRVNCIAPGIIKTDFSKALWEGADTEDEAIFGQIPMGRFGTPDECAGAVAFLCSEDAAYITGETIAMTGGMNARL